MRPRVLDYDDLRDWLDSQALDADGLAVEYDIQGDHDDGAENRGRCKAFREVIDHIEFALEFDR